MFRVYATIFVSVFVVADAIAPIAGQPLVTMAFLSSPAEQPPTRVAIASKPASTISAASVPNHPTKDKLALQLKKPEPAKVVEPVKSVLVPSIGTKPAIAKPVVAKPVVIRPVMAETPMAQPPAVAMASVQPARTTKPTMAIASLAPSNRPKAASKTPAPDDSSDLAEHTPMPMIVAEAPKSTNADNQGDSDDIWKFLKIVVAEFDPDSPISSASESSDHSAPPVRLTAEELRPTAVPAGFNTKSVKLFPIDGRRISFLHKRYGTDFAGPPRMHDEEQTSFDASETEIPTVNLQKLPSMIGRRVAHQVNR